MRKTNTRTTPRTTTTKRPSLFDQLMQEREREILVRYLEQYSGNIAATADALGIGRRTLEGKMLQHGLRDVAGALREKAGIRGPR